MKTKFPLALILFSCFCFIKLFAQEKDSASMNNNKIKIGIGAAFFDLDYFTTDFTDLFIPKIYSNITIANKFRIEPGIGIYNEIYSANKYLDFDIGFLGVKKRENFYFLYGIRPGVIFYDDDFVKQLKFVLGGEYFFSKYFSLGAEVQLRTYYGDDLSDFLKPPRKADIVITTGSMISARFYFK